VWQILHDQFPNLQTVPPVLLHIDYWSGNILWRENEISAVIDWEEAAYGDPAVDVGYGLMNITMMDLPDAADEFLRVYEAETSRTLRNLGFWQLAAAVRPMIAPADWRINQSPGKVVFQKFIEEAKQNI
jgi:aminoglycoside phosphotransferase (APT) family kinase protein